VDPTACPLVGVVGRFGVESGCGLGPCSSQYGGAIVQSAFRDFAARLANDKLLAGYQGEYGIGCGLGVFDEVAVDGERAAVEACQFDHVLMFLPGLSSAGKLLSIGDIDRSPAKIEQSGTALKSTEPRPMRWGNAEPSA